MPRKKITYDLESTKLTKKTPFKEKDARMINDEKVYAEDSKESLIIAVVMTGETIRVLEESYDVKHMAKIKTYGTNRVGYINPRSYV